METRPDPLPTTWTHPKGKRGQGSQAQTLTPASEDRKGSKNTLGRTIRKVNTQQTELAMKAV